KADFYRSKYPILICDPEVLPESHSAIVRDRHIDVGQAIVQRIVAAIPPLNPESAVRCGRYRWQELSRRSTVIVQFQRLAPGIAPIPRAHIEDIATVDKRPRPCGINDMYHATVVYRDAREAVRSDRSAARHRRHAWNSRYLCFRLESLPSVHRFFDGHPA